jgi:hypothetical protein
MPKNSPDAGPESDHENDLIWGAEAIGSEINRSKAQVYHLVATGALDGAVAKLGFKTFVASRKALRNLPFRDQNRNNLSR